MGSCSALSVPDAQPPGALQCTQPPPPHHPQGCSGSLSRLTCCSLRWEETGLQLARIPAALVAMVTSRLELLGQPPASLWSVDQGQTLEACARGRGCHREIGSALHRKNGSPWSRSGDSHPFFLRSQLLLFKVRVCVPTERGLAWEAAQRPPAPRKGCALPVSPQ